MSEYFEGMMWAIMKPPFAIAMLFMGGESMAMKLGVLTIWPGAIFAWMAFAAVTGATA